MKQENKHFNANKWTNCQLEKRTIAALKKKNEMFALKHAEDTKEQLLDYIRKCAEEIGHTPCREEIIGGNFIAQRFGNWSIAVGMIGLPSPGYPPPLKTRKIYKDELKRQVKQRKAENRNTREERKAVRVEKSKIAQVEFEQKKKRDLEWGEEHKADTDEQLLKYVKDRASELGYTPQAKDVIGGEYLRERFISWALMLTLAGLPLPKGMKPPSKKQVNTYFDGVESTAEYRELVLAACR
ncbi:MAG: hypothetical protein IJ017_08950 [Oscillospiraceae bacterium]|nr:hypothetical protein [Oscillospiraceae bacterium]